MNLRESPERLVCSIKISQGCVDEDLSLEPRRLRRIGLDFQQYLLCFSSPICEGVQESLVCQKIDIARAYLEAFADHFLSMDEVLPYHVEFCPPSVNSMIPGIEICQSLEKV